MEGVRLPRRARQRTLAVVLGLCVLGVLAVVGWKSWRIGLEYWYIAKLRSEDRIARDHAAVTLGAMGSVRAVPHLVETLARHHDVPGLDSIILIPPGPAEPSACEDAVKAIGIGALNALEEKLRSKDSRERAWAAHQIGRLGVDAARAADALLAALSDEDGLVRAHAARAIGSVGWRRPEVLRSVGEILLSSASPHAERESSLDALRAAADVTTRHGLTYLADGLTLRASSVTIWDSGTETKTRILKRAGLPREDPRLEALECASKVLSILAEAISAEEDGLRREVVDAFLHVLEPLPDSRLSFDPRPALVKLAADPDAKVRDQAVRPLVRAGAFDESTVSALVRALDDPEVDVRMTTASELTWLGSAAFPVWLAALERGHPVAGEAAADALGKLGASAQSCWPLLLEMLSRVEGASIGSLARALGNVGAASWIGVPELTAALKSPGAAARRGAAAALGYYGTAAGGAGPALLEAIDDEDPSVREAAALSLVSTRGVRLEPLSGKAVPVLAECLSDEDPLVRRHAGEALRNLGPAARAAVPALIEALRNEHGQVNDWALLALGAIGPDARAAGPAVLSILTADDGQDLRDAFRVIRAIGGEPDLAIPVLLRFLVEPHDLYAGFAADSLTAFGERAVPALVEALSSENHRVRAGAIRSLGDLGRAARSALAALAKVEAEDPLERLRVQARMAIERITAGRQF